LLTNTNNKSSNLLTAHNNVYAESKNITPDAKFASGGGGAQGLSASHSERVSIGVMQDAENASLKAQ
jgi:hypothetical protein